MMLMASVPRFDEEKEEEDEKMPGEVDNLNEIMGGF